MSTVKERRGAGTRKSLGVKSTPSAGASRRGSRSGRQMDELAEWAAKARLLPEVRRDLVERVRAEIEAGAYETPEKIEIDDLTGP